jgi:hypothetical protein
MTELKRDIVVGASVIIFIALVGVASYFAFLKDEERHKQLTAEVPATITNVYARRSENPTSGAENIVDISVSYKYVIEDKEYERKIVLGRAASGLYREGQPAKVCYEPQNHEAAELFTASHKCGE